MTTYTRTMQFAGKTTLKNPKNKKLRPPGADTVLNENVSELGSSQAGDLVAFGDTNMSVSFPSYILLSIILNSTSNFITRAYINSLENIIYPPFLDSLFFSLESIKSQMQRALVTPQESLSNQDVVTKSEQSKSAQQELFNDPSFIDKDGYYINKFRNLIKSSFDEALNKKYIDEGVFCDFLINNSPVYKLFGTNSTNNDVVGTINFTETPGVKVMSNLYQTISLPLIGRDSLDATQPGLTDLEYYRVYF